jgi:hypothetical protein
MLFVPTAHRSDVAVNNKGVILFPQLLINNFRDSIPVSPGQVGTNFGVAQTFTGEIFFQLCKKSAEASGNSNFIDSAIPAPMLQKQLQPWMITSK